MAGVSLYSWHITLADSGEDNLFIYDPWVVSPQPDMKMNRTARRITAETQEAHRAFFREGREYRTVVIGVTEDTDLDTLLSLYRRFDSSPVVLKQADHSYALLKTGFEQAERLLEDIIDNPKRYSSNFYEERAHQ